MRSRGFKLRLLIGLGIALFAVVKYCGSAQDNPFTGERQHISLSEEEEIAIGLQSAPAMAEQHGGLHPNNEAQALIDNVGRKLVTNSVAADTDYRYEFHLLSDPNTINAFALPGGQIFITYALFSKLETEDQLAGILGHEIGHVVARHSAERIEQQQLTQGLLNGVAVGIDPNTAQGAAAIASIINMKYGREDELQSDDLGVRFMMKSGYDPEGMIGVMQILKDAAGPNRTPEFQSTHPDPVNRMEKIRESIEKYRAELQ